MCDPLSLGLAAVSTAASIGGALIQNQEAQATVKAQNDANDQWVAYQNLIHRQQALSQDQERTAANTAREATLSKVSPEAQTAQQGAEQQRLTTEYNTPAGGDQGRGTATDVSGYKLSGEGTGNQYAGGGAAVGDLAKQVNQATGQARSRIAALATANSYGGSFGGLGVTVPIAFARGANDINLQNEMRKSDLQTYGVEQQVQPIHYTLPANYGLFGSIANTLAGVAGKAAGAGLASAFGGGGGGFGAGFGGGETGGVASVDTGLTPQFTSDALTSFNDPMWAKAGNPWG